MRLPITASPRLLQLGIRPRDGSLAGPSSYFLRSLPFCSRSITTDLRLPDRSRWVLASRQRPVHVLVSPLRRLQPAFSPSYRRYSTVTAHSQTGFQDVSTSSVRPTTIPRSLPNWLLGCSALVFGILVIGGLTRLTESGLSITEWQPLTGILPPITQAEWDIEWEKYRVSPEGVLTNSKIEMNEFKKIFYMEWAHRLAGRTLGIAFVVPAIYYVSKYRLPRPLPAKLLLIAAGIGFQGFLGWYMVKSGLEQEIIYDKGIPRVSQYRLAAHFSSALALFIGMLHTALGLRRDLKVANLSTAGEVGRTVQSRLAEIINSSAIRNYRGLVRTAGFMVFFTAVSGAFVAGLDAGLVYNEFPTMGGRLIPPTDELMDPRYAKESDGGDRWWRNMLENPVTAQFDHRVFATSTFAVVISLPFLARLRVLRVGASALPVATKRLADLTAVAALTQVTLGITTLLYLVPVPLAAMHQAGSVVLLTCLTALGVSLRKPGRALASMKQGLAVERRRSQH